MGLKADLWAMGLASSGVLQGIIPTLRVSFEVAIFPVQASLDRELSGFSITRRVSEGRMGEDVASDVTSSLADASGWDCYEKRTFEGVRVWKNRPITIDCDRVVLAKLFRCEIVNPGRPITTTR